MLNRTIHISSEVVTGTQQQYLRWLEPNELKDSRSVPRGGSHSRSKFASPMIPLLYKKIFGSEKNKDILIHFINDIMEFKDDEQIKDVTFLSPIQDPEIAYKKQSLVDVLCKAQNGTQIIVEMQVSPAKGFEKRAQYYAAKADNATQQVQSIACRALDTSGQRFISLTTNKQEEKG